VRKLRARQAIKQALAREFNGLLSNTGFNTFSFKQRSKMKQSGDAAVRFVDEYEVLIHSLGIDRSLEHEHVLRSDKTMLHSRLEMKPVSRRERFHREWLVCGTPRKDEPSAFLHLQVFILLFVHLKGKVSTLTDHEILFDPRMLMQNDDHASPRRFYGPLTTPVDAIEKFFKERGRSRGPMAEVLTPEPAGFSAITIKRVSGIDPRLRTQTARDGGKLGVTS
jgi:hypothetical protein